MYITQTKPQKNHARRNGIIAIIVLFLAAGMAFAWHHHQKHPANITTSDGKKVSLVPATPLEKQAVDNNKQAIVDKQAAEKNTLQRTDSQRQITPVITNADGNGVRGFINGIFEDGGTCTATVTSGSKTYTKSATGFKNVSNTQCAPMNWDVPLSAGSWIITLAYSSTGASGSATKTVEIK